MAAPKPVDRRKVEKKPTYTGAPGEPKPIPLRKKYRPR